MNWESVKKSSQVTLSGIKVETDFRDGSLYEVKLTDADGNILRVTRHDYSMTALVPAKPKKIEKHVVTGTVLGLSVDEVMESEFAAKQRAEALTYADPAAKVAVATRQIDEEIPF